MEGIGDSLCVGQKYQGDERVVLFLKMAHGYRLVHGSNVSVLCFNRPSLHPTSFSKDIVSRVKVEIRRQLSARHVPAVILETKDIPVSD